MIEYESGKAGCDSRVLKDHSRPVRTCEIRGLGRGAAGLGQNM